MFATVVPSPPIAAKAELRAFAPAYHCLKVRAAL